MCSNYGGEGAYEPSPFRASEILFFLCVKDRHENSFRFNEVDSCK